MNGLLFAYYLCFNTNYLGVEARKGVYIPINPGVLSVQVNSLSLRPLNQRDV
jgi:hypothetical protein